jgi:hypothetical protein
MPIHLVLSGSLPLKRGSQLFAMAPPMAQHWAVHPSLCQGGGDLGTSLQWRQACHSAACCKHTIQALPKLTFAKI